MVKRVLCVFFSLLLAGGLVGCAPFSSTSKQSQTYMDVFDTVTEITAYGISAEQFSADVQKLYEQLTVYHRLYDIYHTYPELANLKTVNDAAGGAPVKVDSRILDLLEYGLDAYKRTDARVNIVFGAVLSLWHEARERGIATPEQATLPDAAALTAAGEHVSPDALVIDRAAGTVQLTDAAVRIDVGAIAKGYAVERVAEYAQQQLGWSSALFNVGGNIRAIGGKGSERTPFTVGIQNPDTASAKTYLTTAKITNVAVVTSGDYQRYYTVDGKRYAHIIDTQTLYPATYVQAVTVVCADSARADMISTALFCMSPEQGEALLSRNPEVEVLWVLMDGSVRYTDGFAALMEGITQ